MEAHAAIMDAPHSGNDVVDLERVAQHPVAHAAASAKSHLGFLDVEVAEGKRSIQPAWSKCMCVRTTLRTTAGSTPTHLSISSTGVKITRPGRRAAALASMPVSTTMVRWAAVGSRITDTK
jgi:hypothetical protein